MPDGHEEQMDPRPQPAGHGARKQDIPARCGSAEVPTSVAASARELAGALAEPGTDVLLVCEPTLEGILVATGITYLSHSPEEHVRLAPAGAAQPRIGERAIGTPSSAADDGEAVIAFAQRVWRGFGRACASTCPRGCKAGSCPAGCVGACARRLAYAAATDEAGVPEACFRYLRLGFSVGARVREMIADERVAAVNALARFCKEECEHARQFARFSHLSDGAWAAAFRPRADVVPLVAGHFASRMPGERFFLVDPIHRHAAFHRPNRRCEIVVLDKGMAERLARIDDLADDEAYVRALWKRFYDGMALQGRDASQRGYDLRAGWMPKRFWGGLTELDPRSDDPGDHVPERYRG